MFFHIALEGIELLVSLSVSGDLLQKVGQI